MSIVRSLGNKVAEYHVPNKGTWNSVAANMLGPDTLFESMNVFLREGKLRTRPGLSELRPMVFTSPVLGGAMAVTPQQKVLLAVTRNALFTLKVQQTDWQLDSNYALAPNDDTQVDTTFIETANEYVAVFANGSTELSKWISGDGVTAITPVVGSVPLAKSVCTAARRIVALVEPHTLRWTATLTYDNWPALAYAKVAQTNDAGVCVKALGTLDFVLYKERSIYLGKAKAGSDAQAFDVKFIQTVEGPAGIHAVVDVEGMHVYMTPSGRIGVFNGSTRVEWIADGLWLFLQNDIDPVYAERIFGVFDYRLHCVVFYYPRDGDDGFLHGIVIVNLPLEGSGFEGFASFLGDTHKPMSFGYEMRFRQEINRSIVFSAGVENKKSFRLDENAEKDDDFTFQCRFQTPLFPLGDLKSHWVETELFLERGDGFGSVEVNGVTSQTLDTKGGTIDEVNGQVLSLEFDPVREYFGFDVGTRFFGVQVKWMSEARVRYAGGVSYGRVKE